MAIAVERVNKTDARLERHTAQSAPNSNLTLTLPPGAIRRPLFATIRYSSATPSGQIEIRLISGAGPDWNVVLATQAAQQNVVIYFNQNLELLSTDQLEIFVPAAGAGVVSSVAVYVEEVLR